MEQECVSSLYQSLGISVGGVISSADVCNLFHKVFHLPSAVTDVDMVMKKIAGSEDGWSCEGERVLDVLLEMERERGRKEELYWDMQLLNAGLLNAVYKMDASNQALSSMHDLTNTGPRDQAGSVADSESVSLPVHMDPPQRGQVAGQREQRERRRLRRAARQSMARLMSEGVGAAALLSVAPTQKPGAAPGSEVKGQPCGCVSLSDLVTLVDVKYDAVAHTLYTEMLEEHHGGAIWGSLLPWQRAEREAEMEELAEQALESGDLLCLSELPGAFRIYSYPEGVSLRGCPDWQTDGTQSWSSVSLLSEIHTSCQRERETLFNLAKRLDGGDPRLLAAYLRLATLRARREKLSRGALLAATQPWESWPCVRSPGTMEQGKLWLQEEEEEEREEGLALSCSPQQAVLQCLVLNQEKERRFVCRVLHGVSLEYLQGLGGQQPSKDDAPQETNASLREACVRRLRHVHSTLQTQAQQRGTSASAPPPRQPGQESIQTQNQGHSPQAGPCSQSTWGACALVLLTQLMELHDAQVAEILPLLLDLSEQRLLELKKEYEGDLQEQRHTSLLKHLSSNVPSCLDAPPESITPQSSTVIAPITTPGREPERVHVDVNSERQNICADCGAIQEDLPYLEILSMSDTTRPSLDGTAAEGEVEDSQGEDRPQHPPESYEKQGSLIALAWSKPPEEDNESPTETTLAPSAAAEQQGGTTGRASSAEAPSDPATEVSGSFVDRVGSGALESPTQPAGHHCSTPGQEEESPTPIQFIERNEVGLDRDRHRITLVAEAVNAACASPSTDSPVAQDHSDDLSAVLTRDVYLGAAGGQESAMETCSIQTEAEPEPNHAAQRERTSEPVSVLERERTMRSLVDMQRKVEKKQKRDRERQLLRVQERLSIIQNRKSEEDVLGLKRRDRLRHLTHNLPQEDKTQQKSVVRERLEQLKRERSNVMQSKRDRNTAGFRELLGPVANHSEETGDTED